jgi:hypothetical protein
MTLLLYRIGLPGYAMFLLLASGYWLLPMLISAWDGTVLNTQAIHKIAAALESLGSPASTVTMMREFLSGQGAKPAVSLPYLTDLTHLLFAIVVSCGAWLGTETLKNFDRVVKKLSADKVSRAGPAAVSRIYRRYRQLAFATRNIWLCVAIAVCAASFFVYLHFSAQYAFWWGNRLHGAAGLAFAVMVGAMVFAVVWGSLLLVFGSLMLARVISLPIDLRPFHPDGCNGLAPLGKQIFLLWSNAMVGGLAIYVTLRFGYLGVEHTPVAWILAIIGTVVIPAIAVVPLFASLRAVKMVQQKYLRHLGAFLNERLQQADAAIQNAKLDEANKFIGQLENAKKLFEIYKTANVWPFNTRALTLIVLINVVQIVLTAKQLLSLLPA